MELQIVTTYSDLTEKEIQYLKKSIEEIACKSFSIKNNTTNKISFEKVSAIQGGYTVYISIFSDELGQNAGKLLVKFKDEVVNIIEKIHKGFSKENLQTRVRVYQERMSERKDKNNTPSKTPTDEYDYENKSKQFIPEEPLYSFDRVILSEETRNKIEESLAIVLYEQKVFEEWGLYEIQPNPSSCLSFYGPSGTGKTMAAEAVAQKLGKKILKVSYADVESKYHGEGPKMVKAIFLAAQNNDAILFFDEADSLLSKRLTNVTQGSEQAINSMRSQILICLEQFHGIVIFATNLVINYDKAFLTRLISVEFKLPGVEQRELIWNVHIKPQNDGKKHKLNIPLAEDVDISFLAEKYDFVGREIRNAVIKSCVKAAMGKKDFVEQSDFIYGCEVIAKEKEALMMAQDYTKGVSSPLQDAIKKVIVDKVKKQGNSNETASETKDVEN